MLSYQKCCCHSSNSIVSLSRDISYSFVEAFMKIQVSINIENKDDGHNVAKVLMKHSFYNNLNLLSMTNL